MTKDYIRHQGKIERIEKHKVYVRIEQKASCSDCHAKSVCFASDKKDKIIEVNDRSGRYSPREDVIISVRSSMGLFAVVIAFTIPLILVILSVIAGTSASGDEGIGGLAGLSVLVPYYFILYLFRGILKKKFIFTLSKSPERTHNVTNYS
ncbi:MAG: SoxR reducing system RseC family protein [Tannerella sp.]|jgi:sigma-E factor negative regulatory protein RseC|nr:SoxR reducing system RseC family protein [Tannerella sp.]